MSLGGKCENRLHFIKSERWLGVVISAQTCTGLRPRDGKCYDGGYSHLQVDLPDNQQTSNRVDTPPQ